MLLTDPVADMLTRIRNALKNKNESVEIPLSNMKKEIARIMLEEGFINGYEVSSSGVAGTIKITLKYGAKYERIINGLRRISRPGLRVYASQEDLPKVLDGMGMALISTSKGIMTDKQARAAGVGGEVLAYVW